MVNQARSGAQYLYDNIYQLITSKSATTHMSAYRWALYQNRAEADKEATLKQLTELQVKHQQNDGKQPHAYDCRKIATEIQDEINRFNNKLLCSASKMLVPMPLDENPTPLPLMFFGSEIDTKIRNDLINKLTAQVICVNKVVPSDRAHIVNTQVDMAGLFDDIVLTDEMKQVAYDSLNDYLTDMKTVS